jgi:hypothetical protein
MKKTILVLLFYIYVSVSSFGIVKESNSIDLDINKIEKLTGTKGAVIEDEKVYKITIPRDDLNLIIDGIKIPAAAGPASWIAFKKAGNNAMMMGDLILLQDQINPVMTVALENGLQVTALHNHFLWETPRVMFMHIEGVENQDKLAEAISKVTNAMKLPASSKGGTVDSKIDASKTSLDASKMDAILGVKGTLEKGVYKIVVGRKATVDGHEIGKSMGINTWAAFIGSDNEAMMDGDIALTKNELNKVLIALNKAKINIISIHQHMVDADPQYFFVHFYGIGEAESLAKGLRSALDVTKSD